MHKLSKKVLSKRQQFNLMRVENQQTSHLVLTLATLII
jgi:hypothetical protein